jgi:hypothetical protein
MAEVAGLVLGALPIIAEVIQRYGTLYKLCKRFRRCNEGVEELLDCLKHQKVIFCNETRLLLAAAVGSEQARAMVNDPDHVAWRDDSTETRLEVVLDTSKEAIATAAQNVQQKMKHMEDELVKLSVDGSFQVGSKEWRRAIRSRFDFAFSESKLKSSTNAIKRATKDYRQLRAQVQEIVTHQVDRDTDNRTSQEELEKVKATQAAAKHVYEVLASACKLHTKHHAQFSLQPIYASSGTEMEIRFQIAYRHLSSQHVQGSKDVLWFIVESIITGTVSSIPRPMPSLTGHTSGASIKRPISPVTTTLQGSISMHAKRARHRSPSPTNPTVPSNQSSQAPSQLVTHPSPANLPDLSIKADLCTQLRTCCKNGAQSGACIGWLQNSAQWKHRVYHSTGPTSSAVPNPPTDARTLASLLSSLASGRSSCQKLSIIERVRLAKLLSTAMLNFHATPWMQSSWSSRDILLYDFPPASKSHTAALQPNAFVETPVGQLVPCSDQQMSYDILAPFVRNCTVFSLGVMLLELAFAKPLSEMHDPLDRKPGLPPATVDLYAAFRQSKEVAADLGIRYSQIVEKCLHCDFGHGSDLTNPALQTAIHRDVVVELDRLESGFQQLGIV